MLSKVFLERNKNFLLSELGGKINGNIEIISLLPIKFLLQYEQNYSLQ